MKINGQNFKVVGVVQKRGDSGFRSPDDEVTIPVTTAMQRVFGQDYLDSLTIQAVSEERMLEAQDQILAALRKAHRLRPDEESDVRVMNQADITESANQQTTFLTMLLAGIAFVSLIVGGIGIMNIMLVSVTERTREIGIRKAIGAKRRDIRYQFLIESITLSLVGGLIGIGLGVGVSLWMALPADRGGLGFPMLTVHTADCCRVRVLGPCGHVLRYVSRGQGIRARPHRSPALRVTGAGSSRGVTGRFTMKIRHLLAAVFVCIAAVCAPASAQRQPPDKADPDAVQRFHEQHRYTFQLLTMATEGLVEVRTLEEHGNQGGPGEEDPQRDSVAQGRDRKLSQDQARSSMRGSAAA